MNQLTHNNLKSPIVPWVRGSIRRPPLRRVFLVVPLLLGCFGLVSSTTAPRADAAGSGNTPVFRLHGHSAYAGFFTMSPDGCSQIFVDLAATQSNTGQEANVDFLQFDGCTHTANFAFGYTSTPIFQVSNNLDSASLSATFSVVDDFGNTYPVSVSVSWTATSPLTHEIESREFHTNNYIENFHASGALRYASASGTISDGTINFAADPSYFAQIGDFESGDVTISHR